MAGINDISEVGQTLGKADGKIEKGSQRAALISI